MAPEEVGKENDVSAETIVQCLRDNMASFSNARFHAPMSVLAFVLCSETWSLRDMHKKVMNIRHQTISHELCVLTTAIWMKELSFGDYQ